MLLTHSTFIDWPARVLVEKGAVAIDTEAGAQTLRDVHSDMFIKSLRDLHKALAAAAVAEAAVSLERAIFYIGGSAFAGLHTSRRGHVFNAAVYIARKIDAAVVSIDRDFPRGTWELHLEYKFPLYLIYSGAEGPGVKYIYRRGKGAVAIPMPPGAGDLSFKKAVDLVLESGGPVVLHLGFDIHREDPTGYFFASENFYYHLGKSLSSKKFYISLECPSTPAVFKSSLEALLSGLSGGPPPRASPYREGRDVVREVEKVIENVKRSSDRLFRRH
ncbi:MAG: histone deacetylase family protein [Pyrobaculum sp.]